MLSRALHRTAADIRACVDPHPHEDSNLGRFQVGVN
jgi:hypothetical protein